MGKESKVAIQETFILPSRGKCYPNMEVPEQITLRAMNTLDEKMRVSSNNPFLTTPTLIQNCMVGAEADKIVAGDLKFFDLYFLMFKLRTITYGNEYKLRNIYCNNCDKPQELTVNIDDMKVNYLPDDFVEPFNIKLPVSGDVLGCKLLSANDYDSISREAERRKSKGMDDSDFILSYMQRILTINGEAVVPALLEKYIQEMHAKDLRMFDIEYNKIANGVGLDLTYTCQCPSCGAEMEFQVPLVNEFFRPTFE